MYFLDLYFYDSDVREDIGIGSRIENSFFWRNPMKKYWRDRIDTHNSCTWLSDRDMIHRSSMSSETLRTRTADILSIYALFTRYVPTTGITRSIAPDDLIIWLYIPSIYRTREKKCEYNENERCKKARQVLHYLTISITPIKTNKKTRILQYIFFQILYFLISRLFLRSFLDFHRDRIQYLAEQLLYQYQLAPSHIILHFL